MADISFLVFEDEQGFYRLEGDGAIKDRARIEMSKEQADAWIEAHPSSVQAECEHAHAYSYDEDGVRYVECEDCGKVLVRQLLPDEDEA